MNKQIRNCWIKFCVFMYKALKNTPQGALFIKLAADICKLTKYELLRIIELQLVWENFESNGRIATDQFTTMRNNEDPKQQDLFNNLCKLTLRGIPILIIYQFLQAYYSRLCKFCRELGTLDLGYVVVPDDADGITCPNCESLYPGVYLTYKLPQMVLSLKLFLLKT